MDYFVCDCPLCSRLKQMDRAFDAKIFRIGRRYGVPNYRMQRRLIGTVVLTTGQVILKRLPYGHPLE